MIGAVAVVLVIAGIGLGAGAYSMKVKGEVAPQPAAASPVAPVATTATVAEHAPDPVASGGATAKARPEPPFLIARLRRPSRRCEGQAGAARRKRSRCVNRP